MTTYNLPFPNPRNHAEEIENARYLAAAYGFPELTTPERAPEGSSVAYVIIAAAFGTCMGVAVAVVGWVF